MWLFTLYLLAALVVLATMSARCAPPPLFVPENVVQGSEAIWYLWRGVQHGALYKRLPLEYAHVQSVWTNFLHQHAAPIIDAYYLSHFPTRR